MLMVMMEFSKAGSSGFKKRLIFGYYIMEMVQGDEFFGYYYLLHKVMKIPQKS